MKITTAQLREMIREEVTKTNLKEVSEISFKELDSAKQKQINIFEKFFNGKQERILGGINGYIVEIKVPTGKNRLNTSDLKALGNMKLRWIEFDGQIASIGF